MKEDSLADQETRLELFAGEHPNGQPIFEQVLATELENEQYRLLKSPVFVKGLARGDTIKLKPQAKGRFELAEHGGNLCLRVLSRDNIDALDQELTPALEKLGADLDVKTERALVYSIHFGVGFKTIEALMDKHVRGDNCMWLYGNVYDPTTGEPLNWWQDLLKA